MDHPPVSFWQHAPDVDHTAPGLAEAMLAFHRRYDLDVLTLDVPPAHLTAVVQAVRRSRPYPEW